VQRELADRLRASAALLGLLHEAPEAWFTRSRADELGGEAIEALLARRREARARRDFAEADRIRDELTAAGILIEDGAGGTRWRRSG
jgi:cysteinyl-tRNA synthetase